MRGDHRRRIAAHAEERGLREGELTGDATEQDEPSERHRPYGGLREAEDDEVREAERERGRCHEAHGPHGPHGATIDRTNAEWEGCGEAQAMRLRLQGPG